MESASKADLIERVVSTYPAPIAAAAWHVQGLTSHESDVIPKHDRLLLLLESTLQYTGFLLLSYHRQRLKDDGTLLPPILDKLRQPQLGQIRALQRELAVALSADPQSPSLIRTVASYLADTRRDGRILASFTELRKLISRPYGKQRVAISELFDELVSYRNWRRHGAGQLAGAAELAPHVSALEDLLLDILSDLDCLERYPLVSVDQIFVDRDQVRHIQIRLCMGTSHRWRPLELIADREVAAGHCYLCQSNQDGSRTPILDIHPLLLCARCVQEPGGRQQLFILSGQENIGIGKYRSYECGHDLGAEVTESIAQDMDTLLKRERWLQYCTEQAIKLNGRHLARWLQMLKTKRGQPDYVSEYDIVRQMLASEDGFGMPAPLIDSILAFYEVPAPEKVIFEIQSFGTEPDRISPGGSARLKWSVRGAARVSIDPGLGQVPPEGTYQVSPEASTAYTLTATAPDGRSEVRTTQISVAAAPASAIIEDFTISPQQVEPGQSVVLEWRTRDAQRTVISPEPGEVPAAGRIELRPTASITYDLHAWGADGVPLTRATSIVVVTPTGTTAKEPFRRLAQVTLAEEVESLTVLPRTGSVMALGRNNGLFCWRATSRALSRYVHPAPVRAVDLLPDRRRVITADWNGVLRCFDESASTPSWEATVPGVPSNLAAGRWQGQDGIFIGTWRKGIYFCETNGTVREISRSDFTIRALCACVPEGCIAGDAEGGVTRFVNGTKRVSVRESVRAVIAVPNGGAIALTTHDHIYALDADLHVLSFAVTTGRVMAWAAPSGASLLYASDKGRAYRMALTDSDGRRRLRETMFGPCPSDCVALVSEDHGEYVVFRDAGGQLTFHVHGQIIGEPPIATADALGVDRFGFRLATASGTDVHIFDNVHKIEHSRPPEIRVSFGSPKLALGRSGIASVVLTNLGEQPASAVYCQILGRFVKPVEINISQLLPGETVTVPHDVEPAISGSFSLRATLQYDNSASERRQTAQDVGIVEVADHG